MIQFGVHGLNHHNGIIHHNTNSQHQCKQGKQVNGKTKQLRKKNVPTIATGTAIAGINVDLKSCRNINTTINTSIKASISVCITFSIEASKKSLAFNKESV
jgi:hypothetical protein